MDTTTPPKKPTSPLSVIMYAIGVGVLLFIAFNVYACWVVADSVDKAISDPHNGEAISHGVGEFLQALSTVK